MEHIIAAVRIKPSFSQDDKKSQKALVQDVWDVRKDSILDVRENRDQKVYKFDFVFDGTCSNYDVFCNLAKPMIESALNGINCTIFAYGQTASGKTHTIRGSVDNPGLIPESISFFYDSFRLSHSEISIKISYLEIYNEKVNDLLDPSKQDLTIREHPEKGFFVKDLTESQAETKEIALNLLSTGESNRKYAGTQMNRVSSRSHCIFRVTIENSNAYLTKQAQINFIDLAGSECVTKTGADDERLEEGNNINRSLLGLGRLIRNLNKKGKGGHLGYRDTVLTKVLKPALSGNFWTAVICTINPDPAHYHESKNTLDFGVMSRMLENKIEINSKFNESNIEFLNSQKNEVKKLIQKNLELEEENISLCSSNKSLEEFKKNLVETNENHRVLIQQLMEENQQKDLKLLEKQNLLNQVRGRVLDVEGDNRKMSSKIFELEAQASQMTSCTLEMQGVNKQLNLQISLMHEQESLSKNKIVDLEEQNSRFRTRIIELEAENSQLCRGIEEIGRENNRLNLLEPKINELNSQLMKSNQEVKDLLILNKGLEQELNNVFEKNSRIIEDSEKKSLEIENLTETLSKSKKTFDLLSESLSSESLKSSKFLESLNIVQNDLNLKESESLKLSLELSIANKKIDELLFSESELKSKCLDLNDQVKNLSISLSEFEFSLQKERDSKVLLIENFENQLKSKDQEILKLQAPNENLIQRSEEFKSLIIEKKELLKFLEDKNSEIKDLNEKLSSVNQDFNEHKKFSANLVKTYLDQIKTKENELRSLDFKNDSQVKKIQELTSKLQIFLINESSLNLEIEKLEKKIRDQDLELSELKKKIKAQNIEISEINQKIKNSLKKNSELHQENDFQMTEKKSMEGEIYSLEYHCSKNLIIIHPDTRNKENHILDMYNSLITQNEKLNLDNSELLETLNRIKSLNNHLETKCEKLVTENNFLRKISNDSEQKISELKRLINQKRSSMGCLDSNTMQHRSNNESLIFKLNKVENENHHLDEENKKLSKDLIEKNDQNRILEQKLEDSMKENSLLMQNIGKIQYECREINIQKNKLLREKELRIYESPCEREEKDYDKQFMNLGATPTCKTQ